MDSLLTRWSASITAVVIGISLSACGGSSSTRTTATPTPTPTPSPVTDGSPSSAMRTSIPVQSCDANAPQFLPTFTLPARDQGTQCNSCWAYATAAAYEQNYAFKSGQAIEVSASQLLDCSNKGDCNQGTWAFDYIQATGTALNAEYPHTSDRKPCAAGATPLRAINRGFVNINDPVPTTSEIKTAVCAHGAVVGGIVETVAFRNYSGGVFSETTDEPMHHAIVIVGWNDTLGAWRVRNSRGLAWGEQGYGWVSYGSNRIGTSAAWVEADAPARPATPCPPRDIDVSRGTTASTSCEGPVR
jgi:C1A family cysteine protease